MKLAIVTPYGAEPRLDNFAEFILAKKLIESGHTVRFYTYRLSHSALYSNDLVYQGVRVFRCRQRFGLAPRLFFSIVSFRPDAVLYFHPKSLLSFSAYLAARISGAKAISEIVGILHDPFLVSDTDDPVATIKANPRLATSWRSILDWQNFVTHLPIAKADIIVAINQDEQHYIKRFYGRDSTLIHWAVPQADEERISLPPQNADKLPRGFLLFIAQVKKRKGWDTVLEALAYLKRDGIEKQLVFVCPDANVSAAQRYARELGILDQIFYRSGISNEEKNWLYKHAFAVLAPSRYEGFGLSVFEAFAAGKPVLTTKLSIYQELLTDGIDTLISPVGDSKALAANIQTLDRDPELTHKLVAGGYKTVKRFTKEIMEKKFLCLFSSLLSRE